MMLRARGLVGGLRFFCPVPRSPLPRPLGGPPVQKLFYPGVFPVHRSPLSLFRALSSAPPQQAFVVSVLGKGPRAPPPLPESKDEACEHGGMSLAQRVVAAGLLLSAGWAVSPRDSRVHLASKSTARGPRGPNTSEETSSGVRGHAGSMLGACWGMLGACGCMLRACWDSLPARQPVIK